MGSAYLSGADLTTYGVTAPDVATASVLIDGYLQRPEGLVWTPDGNGSPCFMAALTPSMSFTTTATVAPGVSVVVPITGGVPFPDLVGEVLILGRALPEVTEAVVVLAVTKTTITLQSVAFAHDVGVFLEAGLVIYEERALPANRSVTRISRPNLARMIGVSGRYGYGRRSQQQAGLYAVPSILASVQVLGGPPAWYPVNAGDVGCSPITGEVWVPPGGLVANFSDVRMRYVAGFAAGALPSNIKIACATIAVQIAETPELSGNIKSFAAGQTKIEKFADSLLDAETRSMLSSYGVRAFY